jgi:hypothetical protein
MKSKTQKSASKNSTPHTYTPSTSHTAGGDSRKGVVTDPRRKPVAKATPSKAYPGGTPVVLSDTVTARTPQIDKIIAVLLSADVSEAEQKTIADRLQRKLSTKKLSRGSAKGEPFKRVFIQRLPSKAVVKFATESTRPDHVTQFMQITFNPNLMEGDDVTAFADMVKAIFGPQWTRRMNALKYCRLDACVDVAGVLANDLIIMIEGSRVQGTFFVQCDRNGRVQTIYVGSVQSAVHGCVYDQNDSDVYKSLVGEKPSTPHLQRVKARENAELGIINYPGKGRTRFEIRNVLGPMLSIADLASMESAMHRFTVYEVRKTKGVRFDTQFRMYLDCVRLRGVSGARSYLTAGAKKAVMDKVQENENLLTKLSAIWWTPEAFVLDVRLALEQHDLWPLLSPGASSKASPVVEPRDKRITRQGASTMDGDPHFAGLEPDDDE